MGGKKAKAKPAPKLKAKLATQFNCPFCSHANSVEIKMDRKGQVGLLKCRVCYADFEMRINSLHQPVDVFAEWIDQCEALNKKPDTALSRRM
jgi:transcription elongation factor Elf1